MDAYIGPALWVVGTQLYTIIKYINPMPLRYSPAGAVVTLEAWNTLPQKYRDGLKSLRTKEMIDLALACRKDSIRAYEAMVKHGLKPDKMDPKVLADMKKKCKEVWYERAGKDFDKALLDEILMHLAEFRKQNPKKYLRSR